MFELVYVFGDEVCYECYADLQAAVDAMREAVADGAVDARIRFIN